MINDYNPNDKKTLESRTCPCDIFKQCHVFKLIHGYILLTKESVASSANTNSFILFFSSNCTQASESGQSWKNYERSKFN